MTTITASQLLDLLHGIVAIVMTTIVYLQWRRFEVEAYRQRLFLIRDRLFDYAAEGLYGFADAEYVGLREEINANIRWAHRLTTPRFLTVFVLNGPFAAVRRVATSREPMPRHPVLRDARLDLGSLLMRHAIYRATLFYCVLRVAIFIELKRQAWGRDSDDLVVDVTESTAASMQLSAA